MTIPLILQFISTIYKWFQIEKREMKKWTWPILLLQFWPQWRALRIINLDMKQDEIKRKKAEMKKKELMREVTTTEPFLEAFPSILVMTFIGFLALNDRSNFDDYCNNNKLLSGQEGFDTNSTWTCDGYFSGGIALPDEYCKVQPLDNKCAVFSGPGGAAWFFTTYAISIITGSLGITKFLQTGPFSVLTSDGPLGGMCKCRFILILFSVMTSIVTKALFIAFFVLFTLSGRHSWSFRKALGTSGDSITLIAMILLLIGTVIIPNLIFSFISISRSTGFNKKFLLIIMSYPAAWMLPIATYFVIGPFRSNCCSSTNSNMNLGFSKFYSAMNILLTAIMYVAVISYFASYNDFILFPFLSAWSPLLVVGLVLNIICITVNKKCCWSNCCCQNDHQNAQVMNVNHDDLEFVSIEMN